MAKPIYTPPPNPAPSLGDPDFSANASGYLGWFPVFGTYASDLADWFEGDFATVLKNGSAALPSMAFEVDLNTGLFRPSADTLGFSTNGNERMRIADNGRVGIGTSTPSANLDVSGDLRADYHRTKNGNTSSSSLAAISTGQELPTYTTGFLTISSASSGSNSFPSGLYLLSRSDTGTNVTTIAAASGIDSVTIVSNVINFTPSTSSFRSWRYTFLGL